MGIPCGCPVSHSFLRSKKHPQVVKSCVCMHPAHTRLKLRDDPVPRQRFVQTAQTMGKRECWLQALYWFIIKRSFSIKKLSGNFSKHSRVSEVMRTIMRSISIPRLFAAFMLALAFGLTACGNASQSNTNNGASSTTNTPQATHAPGRVTPGQVKLVLAKSQYTSNKV